MSNPYEELLQNPNAKPSPPMPSLSDAPSATGNPYDTLITQPPAPPGPPPRRPAELRAAEYSPRERVGNMAQDALIAMGAQPYTAGRVGRGVVNAASLIPPIGAILSGADVKHYSDRGDPIMAGVSALGVVPGGTAAKRGVQTARGTLPQRALAPEEHQLKDAADDAYNAWRSSGVRYDPRMMDDATNTVALELQKMGSNPAKHPGVWGGLDTGRSLKTQTGMTNDHFETVRQQWQKPAIGEEAAAAVARNTLERYMTNPPPALIRSGTPQEIASDRQLLLMGRGNTAAMKRSEVVTDPLNVAELKGQRGKSFNTTLENKIGALEETAKGQRSTRGFTDAETEMARNAITDRMTRNMDTVGDAMWKVGAQPNMLPGAGIGATLWKGLGFDPVTAAVVGAGSQGALMGGGAALKSAAGDRMRNAVTEAAANLRMRSPMAQAPGSPYERVTDPTAMAQDARKYLMYPWARQEGEEYVERERTPWELR